MRQSAQRVGESSPLAATAARNASSGRGRAVPRREAPASRVAYGVPRRSSRRCAAAMFSQRWNASRRRHRAESAPRT